MRLAAAVLAAVLPLGAGGSAFDAGGVRAWSAADPSAGLDGVALVVRGGLEREASGQNGLAALVAETILRTPVDGTPLRDVLLARGASLTYALGPQYVRWYLEAPPEAIASAASLVARAMSAPDASPVTISAARAALATRIGDEAGNPVLVGLEMLRSSYYRGGAALPALGTAGSVAQLGPADVRAFYTAAYHRAGAAVSIVGRADAAARTAAATLTGALAPGGEVPGRLAVTAPTHPAKRIVTHRDVGAPYVVVGFAAPSPGDAEYPAMLVLRALLGDVFERSSSQTLPPFRRAVGTVYADDIRPASLAVYVNGAQIDPAAAVGAIEALLKGTAAKPLTPAILARYRETARGDWLVAPVSLSDRAWRYVNFEAQGVDPATADTIPAAIENVSAAEIQRVAKKYLLKYTVALVLPRERGAGPT